MATDDRSNGTALFAAVVGGMVSIGLVALLFATGAIGQPTVPDWWERVRDPAGVLCRRLEAEIARVLPGMAHVTCQPHKTEDGVVWFFKGYDRWQAETEEDGKRIVVRFLGRIGLGLHEVLDPEPPPRFGVALMQGVRGRDDLEEKFIAGNFYELVPECVASTVVAKVGACLQERGVISAERFDPDMVRGETDTTAE